MFCDLVLINTGISTNAGEGTDVKLRAADKAKILPGCLNHTHAMTPSFGFVRRHQDIEFCNSFSTSTNLPSQVCRIKYRCVKTKCSHHAVYVAKVQLVNNTQISKLEKLTLHLPQGELYCLLNTNGLPSH